MPREIRYQRFPRTAYLRRVEAMMDDIWDWKAGFVHRANNEALDWAIMRAKLEERAIQMDEIWHRLEHAASYLQGLR